MNRTTMRRERRAFALLLLDRACTGRSDPRLARNRYAAAGAFSVHDRSNDQVARSFLALTSVNAFVTGRHKFATQWNFAADRATVIDSAVFGTAIAASARLATQ